MPRLSARMRAYVDLKPFAGCRQIAEWQAEVEKLETQATGATYERGYADGLANRDTIAAQKYNEGFADGIQSVENMKAGSITVTHLYKRVRLALCDPSGMRHISVINFDTNIVWETEDGDLTDSSGLQGFVIPYGGKMEIGCL